MPLRRTLFARRDVMPRTFIGGDDAKQPVIRRQISGMNNRQHPNVIGEDEAKNLVNVDITVIGERRRRTGITLIEDLSDSPITGMFGYDPQGQTANLLVTEGTNLNRWTGSGAFTTGVKTDFTTSLDTKIVKAYKTGVGDVALVSNGTDNVFEMTPAYAMNDLGNTNTSPPKTTVFESYRNRVWGLLDDELYFSDASPSDYAAAFDRTTNKYRVPVGEERALIGTRDLGLLIVGKEQIWGINPSTVPAATDKPEKLSEYGCAAGKTFIQVGDDYLYLSFDGVRGLRRTEQDKLQYGSSLPISYKLKTELSAISWAYITKACAVYWDSKYFISLPTDGSTYNNQVWIYFPATNGWSVVKGWNVSSWAKFKVSGEERLYAGDAIDGMVYRAWLGASDNGTAIEWTEEGRNEDMGLPFVKKYAGELKVVAKPAGNYDIYVYGSFDNGAYNLLGTMNVSGNLVTFPVTFPVSFYPDAECYKKFPLDPYGEWYSFRYKLYHNTVTTNVDDITIYETSLTAIPQEYDSEEEV